MKIRYRNLFFFGLIIATAACRVQQMPPEVWTITPARATIGQDITLSGAQFGEEPVVTFTQSGTTVQATTFRSKSDGALVVVVPRAPVGTGTVSVQNSQGITDPVSFTVVQPPPLITSLSPVNGLAGALITVNGDHLDRLISVRFGEQSATSTKGTSQQFQTNVPNGLPRGSVPLTVQTEGGQFTTTFYAVGSPVISSFSPKRIRAGGELTITGQYLGGSTVAINNVAVDPAQTRIQDNEIRLTVPVTASSGKVSITTFGQITTTSADSLFIVAAPVVTNLSATEGVKGDVITLTGRNLRDVTEVRFGDTPAQFRIINDTQLSLTVPERPQSGEVNVAVSSAGGQAIYFTPFLAILPPTNVAFDPLRQTRGQAITVTGQSLYRVREVRINGRPAAIQSRVEGAQVRVTVPADATSGPITVVNPAGQATTSRSLVVVQQPIISTFTATAALGGRVVITGQFLQGARVQFTGSATPAVNDGRDTDTEIWVRVPADAQNGPLTLTGDVGNAVTTTTSFTLLGLPTGLDFTPKTGRVGDVITITGQGLSSVTEVKFGNGTSVAAGFQRMTSGGIVSLAVTVPADATSGPICLRNPAGVVCTTAEMNVGR